MPTEIEQAIEHLRQLLEKAHLQENCVVTEKYIDKNILSDLASLEIKIQNLFEEEE